MAKSIEERAHARDEVLEFEREFDAPAALVWKLWKDPEHMVRWHGPEGYWLTHCEIDIRVGGKWKRCMSRAADHAHWIYGEYLEIDEPHRLVFTYVNDFDPFETVVELDFSERDGRTLMRFRQAPFPTVEERDSHGWGWSSGLDLFAAYLTQVKAARGAPVGRPRREGLAEDLVALRKLREETENADRSNPR
jgi:uncharacterized protein YndB with AHSA1/START domain